MEDEQDGRILIAGPDGDPLGNTTDLDELLLFDAVSEAKLSIGIASSEPKTAIIVSARKCIAIPLELQHKIGEGESRAMKPHALAQALNSETR
jgi:hypothetical protein